MLPDMSFQCFRRNLAGQMGGSSKYRVYSLYRRARRVHVHTRARGRMNQMNNIITEKCCFYLAFLDVIDLTWYAVTAHRVTASQLNAAWMMIGCQIEPYQTKFTSEFTYVWLFLFNITAKHKVP